MGKIKQIKDAPTVTTLQLVECAAGRRPADIIITGGRWVCVQTGEIIPSTDIAILGGKIAYIGPSAAHTMGEATRVIEAWDRFLVPGLLDAHMHVESGMLTISEFVRAVLPHGTTGMFIDPHEIANVFGLRGVRLMVDEAATQPVHVWVQVPSCIPSSPGMETPGAVFGPAEVAEALTWPGVIGLGEMMNFPAVIAGDSGLHAELDAARRAGKVLGGHYASPDLGQAFHAYAAAGIMDDHEGTTAKDAVLRARQGMKVMMRYGSAWHDVREQSRAITEDGLSLRNFLLCTDDSHSETLVNEGHMDRVVRHAVTQGLSPLEALQMATINTAEHFGVSHEVGQLAPGRWADILIVSQLNVLSIDTVIARGAVAAEAGTLLLEPVPHRYPAWARDSVCLARPLKPEDFRLPAPTMDKVIVNVIGVIENQAPTQHIRQEMAVVEGEIRPDISQDVCKLALVERHKSSGVVQMGLVHGFGFTVPCAVASTVAHDSHQLLVAGTDETCMATAANYLARCGGGQVVVLNNRVIGAVELKIGGLMSVKRAEDVAREAASVLRGFRECGCTLNNPNMQLSLLALVVIPALRISDLGLVDVTQRKFIPLISGYHNREAGR